MTKRRDPHPIRTWGTLTVICAAIIYGIAQGLPEAVDACLICLGVK